MLKRITQADIQVYASLARQKTWWTNGDIVADTGLPLRLVCRKTQHLRALGLLDCAEVFPAYGYRLAEVTTEAQRAYRQQLEEAGAIYQEMAGKD